ncbi:hypothetical protein [Sphingomonas profundi]|uniref:hypothetical protein n=1 Tax=Alterirhizorhabdus profundi TaxID=2681549 RepID=UPI0012E7E025|nr:hypothetical protein [Sphingomonas profundi]
MAVALLLGLVAPAVAGPPSATVRAVQAAAGAGALEAGAIRFTAVQPKGRGATVYEARRGPAGVTRTITDLSPGDGGAWSVDGRETKPMAAETLDYFTGRIDAAIAASPSEAECADAPDYYAEHGAAGTAGGGCATDHPNAAIARALGLADPVQP